MRPRNEDDRQDEPARWALLAAIVASWLCLFITLALLAGQSPIHLV